MDRALTVAAPADHSLEIGVLERVVLDLHCQPLLARIGRTALSAPPMSGSVPSTSSRKS